MDTRITLKKSHFAGQDIRLGPDLVSNGKWAVRRRCLANEALFASEDTAAAAFGLEAHDLNSTFDTLMGHHTVPWVSTPYLFSQGKRLLRLLSDGLGGVALLDRVYLGAVGRDESGYTWYSNSEGNAPFRDALDRDEAEVLIMPCSNHDLPPSPWAIPTPEATEAA
jgi:hypothetical protein